MGVLVRRHACRALAFVALTMTVAETASAQECVSPKPDWVFCDDFESSADQDGNLGLWDDQGLGPQNLVVTANAANVHGGTRALEITAHKGKDTGGGPTKWFLPGYDDVYVRFWTRFSPGYHYLHHMVFIGASQASDKWSAFGTAGCRPSGSNFFVTQVEPFGENGAHAPPGAWGFYTYSNDMTCDSQASCANYNDPQAICDNCATRGSPCNTNGLECCWGANDIADPPVIPALGTWTCLEARVQANTNAQSNGVQTLWVDGAEVGRWSGIRYRTDDALKINSIGLWEYVTDDVYAAGQTEETLWFDDVVVATSPIGCGQAPDGGTTTGTGGGSAVSTGGRTGGSGAASSAGGRAGSAGIATGGVVTSGGTTGGGGASTTGGAGAVDGGAVVAASSVETRDQGGCGCRVSAPSRAPTAAAIAVALVGFLRRGRGDRRGTRRAA